MTTKFHQSGTLLLMTCLLAIPAPASLAQEQPNKLRLGNTAQGAPIYYCPMHPEVESHEPGRCPKCKMFLVAKEEDKEAAADERHAEAARSTTRHEEHNHEAHQGQSTASDGSKQHAHLTEAPKTDIFAKPVASEPSGKITYVCPMHAHIISDKPGSCPICGMALEPVQHEGSDEVRVEVSGSMQQALALRVARAERDTLWRLVNTVGQIEYNERQIHHLHSRVSGWIEKLKVNAVGDKVSKGQLLYQLYSPELITAQDDYLLALDAQKSYAKETRYQELVRKSKLRLELLGMDERQIRTLIQNGKSSYVVPFYAKEDGVVTVLNVREGMYIQPMTEIMASTDISKVWVIADVFENEQNWLEVGQDAEVEVPAMGLVGIRGTIDYIYPELDPVTRSLRVRVVLNNQSRDLRPNTLAKVKFFGAPKKDVLAIPQEALIQTGKENRVIVRTEDNSFIARQVSVGILAQGKAEILSGLEDGELVVTSGQFLLDSEASLKGSLMRLGSGHQH